MDERKSRIASVDIFRAENTGSILWLGAAESVAEAKTLVQEIGVGSPGEYLLLNQATGNKLVVHLEYSDDAPDGIGNQSQKQAQIE